MKTLRERVPASKEKALIVEPDTPLHHQPITYGLDTGQVGEIGTAWYGFLRAILTTERAIEQRRAIREQVRAPAKDLEPIPDWQKETCA